MVGNSSEHRCGSIELVVENSTGHTVIEIRHPDKDETVVIDVETIEGAERLIEAIHTAIQHYKLNMIQN